jgi:Flp pilus assembly protein TadG
MNKPGRRRREAGVATLEMLIVLPILLFVLFATVELSRAWLALNLATTAAREGARVGAVTPTSSGGGFDPAPALARIDQILASANLTSVSTRSVTCSAPCASDSQVQATVTVTFQTVVPVILPMLSSVNLQQTAVMRYE